jgi:hypothetical protein
MPQPNGLPERKKVAPKKTVKIGRPGYKVSTDAAFIHTTYYPYYLYTTQLND